MKKAAAFLVSIFLSIGILLSSIKVYDKRLGDSFYEAIGDIYANEYINKGLEIQEREANLSDSMMLFGSSDLGTLDVPTHPSNFFKGKSGGFKTYVIGRGFSQSIIHAINFGGLGECIKDKKIGFFISPPWFQKDMLTPDKFIMNFSELQFYSLMFNSKIDKDIKTKIADRVYYYVKNNENLRHIRDFCYIYIMDNFMAKPIYYIMLPYHKIKFNLLSIKDKMNTESVFKKFEGKPKYEVVKQTEFDWDKEKKLAIEYGRLHSSNNKYAIDNKYYDTYLRDKLPKYKGHYKNQSYLGSQEFEDFELLLKLCKSIGIKPLFINVPIKGKWFDYGEFSKADREEYYKRINEMVLRYGFDLADYSGHEYDDYFLKDIFHIGWEGWVCIDEALYKYYQK
jgi:D-alanine transfer protein